MPPRRVRSWIVSASVLLAASGSVVASSSAAAVTPSSAAQSATCTRPGYQNYGDYGTLTQNLSIRAGVNMACPSNGDGYKGYPIDIWCRYRNEGIWWVLIVMQDGYKSTRGWVPEQWVDAVEIGPCPIKG